MDDHEDEGKATQNDSQVEDEKHLKGPGSCNKPQKLTTGIKNRIRHSSWNNKDNRKYTWKKIHTKVTRHKERMTVFLPLFSDSDLGSLDPGPLKSSVVELMLSDVVAIVVVVVLSVG
jgi:hypothetical protein